MSSAQDELQHYLKVKAEFMEATGVPAGMVIPPRLLLTHGRSFETDEKTYAGKRGTPKQCYANAGKLALYNSDMIYVEGVIAHIIPIDHAWCVNRKTGKVVDPTLKDGSNTKAYFGIPFSTEYLEEVVFSKKFWGLISHTNMDLFKGGVAPADFLAACPFDPGQPPVEFGPGTPCPICGDIGTMSDEDLARPSRCISQR